MINRDSFSDELSGSDAKLKRRINRDLECSLPCRVKEVISRTRVTVEILITLVTNGGQTIQRTPFVEIPVKTWGAGDKLISFPVSEGNLGWIEASDRDISIFLQNYDVSKPGTRRMHSFSDGAFVPDIMHNFTVASEDSGAVVLQNRNGSVKIAIDDTEIRIVNGNVRGVIGASAVDWVAPGGFTINGTVIDSAGDIQTANGARSTAGGFITNSGVSLDDHTHNQGNDSDGNSQVPTDPPTPTE